MNTEEAKKIIDSIVFNNPEVKELVAKGWVEPESTIQSNFMIAGQSCIKYRYRFFGSDCWFDARVLNCDGDSKFLCGWFANDPDALKKAADTVIYELTHKCSLKHKKEYDDAIDSIYSEPYVSGRYNGD